VPRARAAAAVRSVADPTHTRRRSDARCRARGADRDACGGAEAGGGFFLPRLPSTMRDVMRARPLAASIAVAFVSLLAGCATTGYDAHYPICSVLPSGVAGCK
jgi:hypothetical protein